MVLLEKDGKITSNIVMPTDKNVIDNCDWELYEAQYDFSRICSYHLVSEAMVSISKNENRWDIAQKINLMELLPSDMKDISIAEEIITALSYESYNYIIKNFKDFNYFCNRVLPSIEFKEVGIINTNNANIIKEARDNSKILELAYTAINRNVEKNNKKL